MSLSDFSISVLTRALPKEKIQTRPGKAGKDFKYIDPPFVIETLNEAFGHNWSTKIVYSQLHDNVVIVGLQLSVPSNNGEVVFKEQFGSCDINYGMDIGSAFKGAASDAMKKCATLLGLGLELYKDDEGPASTPRFTPPPTRNVPRPPPSAASDTPPSSPAPVRAPFPTAPAAPAAPRPPAPPAPQAFPKKETPFANAKTATAPKPPAPVAPARPAQNPFLSKTAQVSGGPSTTQMNSLANIASRKGLSQSELIGLAGIVDSTNSPVQTFEELTYAQAIQVIQAAQR